MALPEEHINSTPAQVENAKEEAEKSAPAATEKKQTRLLSLDAFRGFTILLMLLVNNIALDTFTPRHFTHAAWNQGLNLADFVAPWFLFCVGVAIPFSAASFKKTGEPIWKYDLKILRRGGLLILLGCLIDSSLYNGPVFCLDVLQLIGLAYIIGALLYDLPLFRRMTIAAFLLLGYWAAIKFLPVPGVGAGVFEETKNFVTHLNRTYLDPVNLAGLPSIIPTAALVLIGSAVGDILRRRDRDPMWTVGWLIIVGAILSIGGLIWNTSLGFNKPLWTPSYILLTAGTGSAILGILYLIIDTHGWKKWSFPLIVFGSNAIVAYVAPILVKVLILQKWQVPVAHGKTVPLLQHFLDILVNYLGKIPGGWLYTIAYIAVWWVILWQLYRKKIFLRV